MRFPPVVPAAVVVADRPLLHLDVVRPERLQPSNPSLSVINLFFAVKIIFWPKRLAYYTIVSIATVINTKRSINYVSKRFL